MTLSEEDEAIELKEAKVLSTELSIFLVFIALLLGMFTKLVTKKLNFPYTPALTILGIIIASIDLHVFRKSQIEYEPEQNDHEKVGR
mgnify:CR=1 FL=1